jgi:hypothetical protein
VQGAPVSKKEGTKSPKKQQNHVESHSSLNDLTMQV